MANLLTNTTGRYAADGESMEVDARRRRAAPALNGTPVPLREHPSMTGPLGY